MKVAQILKGYHEEGTRKYMTLLIEGEVYRVKVPFRYNRVMCQVDGIRPVQDYKADEIVIVEIEKKMWDGELFFVLKSLREGV
jgi:hypothetical protein